MWKEARQFKCDAQETHFSNMAPPKCSNKHFPHIFSANADSKKRGVLTAIRDRVSFHLHEEIKDTQRCYIILICDLNSTMYTIANIYAPNSNQISFFNKIIHRIRAPHKGSLIICGDFNLFPDAQIVGCAEEQQQITSVKNVEICGNKGEVGE